MAEQQLPFDDIQGFILRGYTFMYSRYLFLQFQSAAQGQQWLAQVVEWTTPSVEWKEKPRLSQNIAFTYDGLKALGMAEKDLGTFSREFKDGMHTRCKIIGDTIFPSRPDDWEFGNPSKPEQQIHALLIIFGLTKKDLNDFSDQHAEVRKAVGGIDLLHTVDGVRRFDKKEHFGFLDGASQPAIEGSSIGLASEAPDPKSPVRPIKTGEFVLGYTNEYGIVPPSPVVSADARAAKLPTLEDKPDVRDFGKNGTYVVCRQLYQNVAAFRQFLKINAPSFSEEASKAEKMSETEWLAAKLVGRWRSGTPLALSPDKDDVIAGKRENNNFTFGNDPEGQHCPVGSHIRRSNPRDSFGLPEAHGEESFKAVNRHRILRRGMPYGTALEDDKDDGEDRGLMFLCINTDLAVQYEFVQKWMNDPSFNGLSYDQDVFAHNHVGKSYGSVPVTPVRKRVNYTQNFVTVKGGAYFFMPSMTALRYLATP